MEEIGEAAAALDTPESREDAPSASPLRPRGDPPSPLPLEEARARLRSHLEAGRQELERTRREMREKEARREQREMTRARREAAKYLNMGCL